MITVQSMRQLVRQMMVKSMAVVDDGKEAVTHFNVLEHFKDYTLVECKLKQDVRINSCAHEYWLPLVGDPKYGPKKTLDIGGQALHAGLINRTSSNGSILKDML